MLTRLKVKGFKNLVDIDVRFGPFTCVAGGNAVGKSNLFDAISFLAALADRPFVDAALGVRDEHGRSGDIRSLFHRCGDRYAPSMEFEAEMIVPAEGIDDLGQTAKATITFLRYTLELRYRERNGSGASGPLELVREKLEHIRKGEAHDHLLFPHNVREWRSTAVTGQGTGHRSAPFLSTDARPEGAIVQIHQEGGGGRARPLLAQQLPRTVLSTANAAEMPTASLARQEMRSWRVLQLEPSALRLPDSFVAPAKLGMDGSHLAATVYRLAQTSGRGGETGLPDQESFYAHLAAGVNELAGDIRDIRIDRDEKRELLTLQATSRDGTVHPARSLSDGTLRFLALAVLGYDPEVTGLICLEEPENGIHPAKIPAMVRLLESLAVRTDERVSSDNPLRQVIVNTHSPSVVAAVDEEDLLFASMKEHVEPDSTRYQRLSLECLEGTWRRSKAGMRTIAKGDLLIYLDPVQAVRVLQAGPAKRRRVADREDLNLSLFAEVS